MPVNDPKVIQSSTLLGNPSPLLTMEGTRYPSRVQARAAVLKNVFNQFTSTIPKTATHVALATGITADV